MSWGGAPPWVYKNEIAYHSSQANRYSSKASKAQEIASVQTAENQKCQKRIQQIKDQIFKLESILDQNKNNTKKNSKNQDQITLILNEIKKILDES
jgi:hypothetical protein